MVFNDHFWNVFMTVPSPFRRDTFIVPYRPSPWPSKHVPWPFSPDRFTVLFSYLLWLTSFAQIYFSSFLDGNGDRRWWYPDETVTITFQKFKIYWSKSSYLFNSSNETNRYHFMTKIYLLFSYTVNERK